MRLFKSKILLGLVTALTLTSSCQRSGSAPHGPRLAALATVIAYTGLVGQYSFPATSAFPHRLDEFVLTHNGTEGQIEFSFDGPSGAVVAEPSRGSLDPGGSQTIRFSASGYTHLAAIMTVSVVYAAALGSNDLLTVPLRFLLNGGNLPALATIMAITAPTALRHMLLPGLVYPHKLDAITLRNNATSGPPVNYELSSPGPIGGAVAKGTLAPGEEVRIDLQAFNHNFQLATLTLLVTYAIVASTERLLRTYEFENAAPPGLAVLGIINLITNNSPMVGAYFWPGLILAFLFILVLHSKLGVPSKIPLLLYTEIALVGVMTMFLTLAMLQANFWRSRTAQEAVVNFPPGAGPNGYTIHPEKEVDMQPGQYHFFHMTMREAIPLAEPGNRRLVYSFVMESDGVTANDWRPLPQFPNDFFKGTDRWYQVTYNAKGQHEWRLQVSQVNGSQRIAETTSAARAILKDNGIVLCVPASEFALAKPSWRATSFAHEGDFGINPPHVWSGDLMPAVKDGLNKMR